MTTEQLEQQKTEQLDTQNDIIVDEQVDAVETIADLDAEQTIAIDLETDAQIEIEAQVETEAQVDTEARVDTEAQTEIEATIPQEQLIPILEAAIFAAGEPVTIDRLLVLFPEEEKPSKTEIRAALDTLAEQYAERALELKKVATGYRFQARQDYAPWLQRLWDRKPPRYSRALLETLALIIYRQPITRGEIEDVRGVAVSSNIIKTLMEREWISVVGHRDVPGKPALFATTKKFLADMNFTSLSELPPLADIVDLDAVGEQLTEKLEQTELALGDDGDSNSNEPRTDCV